MIHEIDYDVHHRRILYVLSEMKHSLDQYIKKDNHNADWAKTRQDQLITIAEYVKATQRTLEQMETERQASYLAGYQKGKKERVGEQSWRGKINLLDALKIIDIDPEMLLKYARQTKAKEQFRILNHERAKGTWPEHY